MPEYARHTRLDQDADVMRMLADHAEIRAMVLDLRSGERKTGDPAETMAHFAQLLHDHVRLEENEIFPRIEKVLGEKKFECNGPRDLRACIPRRTLAIFRRGTVTQTSQVAGKQKAVIPRRAARRGIALFLDVNQ